MNKTQERVVERIRRDVMKTFDLSRGAGEYEMKEFTVNECKYFVSVVAEVGMVNDEGTLASILCRNRVQLFIGERGGITYPVFKNGKSYRKRFTGYFTTYMEQK